MIVLEGSHSRPIIFFASYTRGDEMTARTHSIITELASTGHPWLHDDPIIGEPIDRANNIMGRRFLDSPCDYLLHVDADNVLPQGSLKQMLSAIESGADLVTLHSCNRGSGWSGMEKLWQFPDNHVRFFDGHIFFAQAVILMKRKVLETLPYPWWRRNFSCDKCGTSVSGEIYFCHSVLARPDIRFLALDIVSPHLEIVVYRGAGSDFRFNRRDNEGEGGHLIKVYDIGRR